MVLMSHNNTVHKTQQLIRFYEKKRGKKNVTLKEPICTIQAMFQALTVLHLKVTYPHTLPVALQLHRSFSLAFVHLHLLVLVTRINPHILEQCFRSLISKRAKCISYERDSVLARSL